ncbi:MAG: diguanylate cyclase [Magnetococcales bacterium]|nr:diguanylate cyclase [Magnetococcales bacterium]MBF0439821.1 diguanylate cyclase [Magnetococcales bacterium]
MNSVNDVLERVLALLKAQPPHLATARKQLDELLANNPCAAEIDASRQIVIRLLDQLATPVLAMHPEMRVVAEGLRARILHAGSLNGMRTPLEKGSTWIAKSAFAKETQETLPSSLSLRLLTALRLSGESDAHLVAETTRLIEQEQGLNPWPELETLLNDVVTLSKESMSASWVAERQMLRTAITKTMIDVVEQQDSDPASLADITFMLRQRGKQLRQRAHSLATRIEESRELAERLRKRLRQLEDAVSQSRLDGFMDPITGLPDRFAFTAQLKRHLERATHLNEPFSLCLIYLYDFSSLLPRLGRDGEVRLLNGLVREMRHHLREEEFLARLSMERIVILFPKSDQNRAEVAAKEIEEMLSQTQFLLDDKELILEAYCGTLILDPEMSGKEMLEMTDRVAAASRTMRREAGLRPPHLLTMRSVSC